MKSVRFLLMFALASSACDDPADDVASATVVEGQTEESTPEPETPAARESLTIASDSTIGFTGSKVTGSHDGGFREFAGTIEFSPGDPTRSSVEVTIQTASLFTDNDQLTGHLKSDEFFDVAAIPTASFRTTTITVGGEGDATHMLTGVLNLHGQEHTIRFPAKVDVSASEVRAVAEFSIDRQQFGITFPGMPDDLIRDDVVIRLDLKAPRSSK